MAFENSIALSRLTRIEQLVVIWMLALSVFQPVLKPG